MVCSALQCFLNLFLHYILYIFQVVEIIGGGGGGQNDIPAPQDRRLCHCHVSLNSTRSCVLLNLLSVDHKTQLVLFITH